jgi:hypothetical protein
MTSGRRTDVSPRALEASTSYVPSPMDVDALQNQLIVLSAIGATTAYWWFVLVPNARVSLAKNKKTGALRTYLEELKTDDSRPIERWFFEKWLRKIDPETRYLLRDDDVDETVEGASTSPSAAAASPERDADAPRREPSLEEILRAAKKTPKFWSLDNPVLVGTGLSIGVAALFSSPPS